MGSRDLRGARTRAPRGGNPPHPRACHRRSTRADRDGGRHARRLGRGAGGAAAAHADGRAVQRALVVAVMAATIAGQLTTLTYAHHHRADLGSGGRGCGASCTACSPAGASSPPGWPGRDRRRPRPRGARAADPGLGARARVPGGLGYRRGRGPGRARGRGVRLPRLGAGAAGALVVPTRGDHARGGRVHPRARGHAERAPADPGAGDGDRRAARKTRSTLPGLAAHLVNNAAAMGLVVGGVG